MTNTTPTPDLSSSAESARRVSPELAPLIARHSGEPVGHAIELRPGDPLFVAETARVSRRYPVSDAKPNGTLFATDLYAFDGSQLSWRDPVAPDPARVFPGVRFTGEANRAFIGDGFIAVGRGQFVFAGDEDGEWVYVPVLPYTDPLARPASSGPAAPAGDDVDERVHVSLRHLFRHAERYDLREPDAVPGMLQEGDPLWVDQSEVRTYPAAGLQTQVADIRVYDLASGRRIHGVFPEAWLSERFAAIGDARRAAWVRSWPNTWFADADFLFVSGGVWVATEAADVDSEFRFVPVDTELNRLNDRASRVKREWLHKNAELVARVRPAWADDDLTDVDALDVDALDGYLGALSLSFSRKVGSTVQIELMFRVVRDETVGRAVPEVWVTEPSGPGDSAVFTADVAARVGADLIEAARILSLESVTTVAIPRPGCERHHDGTHTPCGDCELARMDRVRWMAEHAEAARIPEPESEGQS